MLAKDAVICDKVEVEQVIQNRFTKPLHYHCANPAIRGFPRFSGRHGQLGKRETRGTQRFMVSQKVAQSVPSLFMERNGPETPLARCRGLPHERIGVR